MGKKPQVAIVHDWLYGGGAEVVVEALHKLYPEAPIYTSYCSEEWQKRLDGKVITGYLQNWPFSKLRKFLPVLRQWWFQKLDLREFDVIISSSGNGEAKFAKKRPGATHVCYCHTPTHFYWRKYEEYLRTPGFRPQWLVRLGLQIFMKPLRKRDYKAAQAVDYFIANSTHIQNDIQTYYGRESTVIHPPVATEEFGKQKARNQKQETRRGFIIWGRHTPYKRFDIAVAACTTLNIPLTVVGSGPETKRLKKLAGPTITFAGWIEQSELLVLAGQAAGFIFPTEEDFGIAPVEAMAAGLPVIAYKAGGALDYVVPNKTGLFFEEQTVESLIKALRRFDLSQFQQDEIRKYARQFSQGAFGTNMKSFVSTLDQPASAKQ